MVLGAGQLKPAPEIVPSTAHVASVDTTPGVEYGRYLAAMGGCAACHGPSLAGGPGVDDNGPPASNLTPTGIGHYTEDDFVNAMRTGVRPRGGAAISEAMPWKYYGTMSDGALRSIHRYLKTVPPKPFGAE
jgi:cytochrome c553